MAYDLSTPEGMDYFKKMNPGATVNARMEYFLTHTMQEAIRAGLMNLLPRGESAPPPGFATGVENFPRRPAIARRARARAVEAPVREQHLSARQGRWRGRGASFRMEPAR